VGNQPPSGKHDGCAAPRNTDAVLDAELGLLGDFDAAWGDDDVLLEVGSGDESDS
jgi:hypothetical protein